MNVLRSQESGDRGQNERTGLTKGLATLMVSEANRVPSGQRHRMCRGTLWVGHLMDTVIFRKRISFVRGLLEVHSRGILNSDY